MLEATSSPMPTARLGDAVRARRTQRRLSLAALAQRVSCSKSYLSAIENGRCGPPGAGILRRLEEALATRVGELSRLADLQATPSVIRRELAELHQRQQAVGRVAELLRASAGEGASALNSAFRSGELRRLIDRLSPPGESEPDLAALPLEVPVVNEVQAGYPREFTDMGFPARVADEYVRCPDLADPDAFAARVVGDSMTPDYRKGDIVIFSPIREALSGSDCLARVAPDDEVTFVRVFFETGPNDEELIRLQPLNPAHASKTLARDEVLRMFAAVSVMRQIG